MSDKIPVGAGGRARERTIDSNVSAMAGPGAPSQTPPQTSSPGRRQPAQPSSYAPSGKRLENFDFGVPMHEDRVTAPQSRSEERNRKIQRMQAAQQLETPHQKLINESNAAASEAARMRTK